MSDNLNTGKVIISVSVAGGILFGIYKQQGFLATFGYAMAFGVAGLIVSALSGQVITK